MKDRIDSLNQENTSAIEVEGRQDAIMNREDFRTGLGQKNTYTGRPRYGQNYRGRSRYDSNYRGSYRYNMTSNKDMGDRIIITEGESLEIKIMRGKRSRSYERKNRDRRDDRSISKSRSRSGSRATINRHRIRCFECREYDHFARDCLTIQANREAEKIQQMINMDEEQTILQTPLMDVDQDGPP